METAPPSNLKTAYSLYVEDQAATSLDENSANQSFDVYPNPASDNLTIEYISNSTEEMLFEVYDASGKLVASHTDLKPTEGNQVLNVNVSHLNAGVYICKLVHGDVVLNKKVVKQ